ncbi:hypothetical protein AB0I50_33915, partial [Streptomyces prunicolor]
MADHEEGDQGGGDADQPGDEQEHVDAMGSRGTDRLIDDVSGSGRGGVQDLGGLPGGDVVSEGGRRGQVLSDEGVLGTGGEDAAQQSDAEGESHLAGGV